MNKIWHVARFTLSEIITSPAYRVLLLFTLLNAIAATVISNLFLLEISKVQVDFIWLGMGVLTTGFVLIIAANLLAQDIHQRTAYLFLPHMTRHHFLTGRIIGMVAALIVLLFALSLTSGTVLAWNVSQTPEVLRRGISLWLIGELAGINFIQTLTLLAIVLFTASWASGLVETLLFSAAFASLAFILPSINEILQSPEVIKLTPVWVAQLIHFIDLLFPDLTGAQFVLARTHGITIPFSDLLWFLCGQIGYILLIGSIGFRLFSKRDI